MQQTPVISTCNENISSQKSPSVQLESACKLDSGAQQTEPLNFTSTCQGSESPASNHEDAVQCNADLVDSMVIMDVRLELPGTLDKYSLKPNDCFIYAK